MSRLLHVGLNAVFLTPGAQGGMEVYARQLARHLAGREDLRVTVFVNLDASGTGWDAAEVVVPVHASDRKQWVWGEQYHLPRMAAAAGCDVVHSLASTAPFRGPFVRVTSIHDLAYRLVPEAHPGRRAAGMEVLVGLASRRSHRVLASSAATASDLVTHLRLPGAKIETVHLGINPESVVLPTHEGALRAKYDLQSGPFVLSVAAKRPTKNLSRLIGAHARLRDPRPMLVLAGYATPHELVLKDRASALGTAAEIRFLDWVSDEDVEGLYRSARIFAFPSLFEGFGLPPLEAMARGLPVVTSDRGSLGEVVGDAALVVDPMSEDELASAMQRLLDDGAEWRRLRSAGLDRAASFTWARTADSTVGAYARAMADANVERSVEPWPVAVAHVAANVGDVLRRARTAATDAR